MNATDSIAKNAALAERIVELERIEKGLKFMWDEMNGDVGNNINLTKAVKVLAKCQIRIYRELISILRCGAESPNFSGFDFLSMFNNS
jgi:hypothetical protein